MKSLTPFFMFDSEELSNHSHPPSSSALYLGKLLRMARAPSLGSNSKFKAHEQPYMHKAPHPSPSLLAQ